MVDDSQQQGGFFKGLEDSYYSFCEKLQNDYHIPMIDAFVNPIESKGIPSFPIFIILILLLVGGFGALVFFGTQSQTATLKIIVMSDAGDVDGANIKLTYGQTSMDAQTVEGYAEFTKLPKGKEATLTVKKEGFSDEEKKITIGAANQIEILLTGPVPAVQFGLDAIVQVLDFEGTPLEGARVEYSYTDKGGNDQSDYLLTNSQGEISFKAPEQIDIALKVVLTGYEVREATVKFAKNTLLKKIVIKKIEIPTNPIPSGNDYSQLEVEVKDDEDGSLIDAKISIYDSLTQGVLKEATTKFGIFKTSDIKVDSIVKITAKADGYESQTKVKTLQSKSTVSILLKKLPANDINGTGNSTNQAVITVVDENGSPLSTEIRLWQFQNEGNYTLYDKRQAASELRVRVLEESIYYATAYKDGYLPGRTFRFDGPNKKEIKLIKADATNSVNLTITVKNEDLAPVSLASIGFIDELFDPMPPFDLKTAANGKISIKNFPKGNVDIIASKPPAKAEMFLNIMDSQTDITLTLYSPRGSLELSAVDWDTNKTIRKFNVYAYYSDDANKTLITSCGATNGTCAIDARSDKELRLAIFSDNYENASDVRVRAVAGSLKPFQLKLKHLQSSAISKIAFEKITDLNGNATDKLVAESLYLASFDVYSKSGSDYNGVFLSLQSPEGKEIAQILGANFAGNAPIAQIGGQLLPTASSCNIGSQGAPFSWIDAQYEFRGSSKVVFLIKVLSNLNANNLLVRYRSYSSSNEEYFRDPEDKNLWLYFETLNTSWCLAATKNVSFAVSSCGNFGEVCCVDRDNPNGSPNSCNLGFQCIKNTALQSTTLSSSSSSASSSGICTFPTACGSYNYFCGDDSICCQNGNSRSCSSKESCTIANNKQCTPTCNTNNEYCNAAQLSRTPFCESYDELCGGSNRPCCSIGAKCESNLGCQENNFCGACGGLGDICCSYTDQNPASACAGTLQCASISATKQICKNSQICGEGQSVCSGGTVCCKDSDTSGQCLLDSQCETPVKCGNCGLDQYCDSTILNAPICKSCYANPSACEFSGLGELCSKKDPKYTCPSGFVCDLKDGTDYGLCESCGGQGEQCCDGTNKCGQNNLTCSPATNTCQQCGGLSQVCCANNKCNADFTQCSEGMCKIGNQECNGDACLLMEFEQKQCDFLGNNCKQEKGTTGFIAHAIGEECGENCTEGSLIIKYNIEDVAKKFPGNLKITIGDENALFVRSIISGLPLRATQLEERTKTFNIPITDENWAIGKLITSPLTEIGKLVVTAEYTNAGDMAPLEIKPYISIISNMPVKPPASLPNPFDCEKLIINRTLYQQVQQPVVLSSCDKITFQVDSIFPMDAIPMDSSGMDSCGTWDMQFGTISEPNKYNYCFTWSNKETAGQIGGEALRYWPTRDQRCPLLPIGNSVPAANVQITVRCGIPKGISKLINLTISNFTLTGGIKAIDVATINYKKPPFMDFALPYSYYGVHDDIYSLKLLYTLNNRVKDAASPRSSDKADVLWISDYRAESGIGFAKFGTSSKLMGRAMEPLEYASLLAWNTEKAKNIKIYSDPDNSKYVEKYPPLVTEIKFDSSKNKISQTGLSDLLILKAKMNAGLKKLQDENRVCKEQCPEKAKEQYDSCFEECTEIKRPSMIRSFTEKMCKATCEKSKANFKTTCNRDCDDKLVMDTDAAFTKSLLSEFKSIAKDVAKATVFKRSFSKKIYCITEKPTESDTLDSEKCRESLAAWMTIEEIRGESTRSCTFCADRYQSVYGTPAEGNENIKDCDSRCQPDDTEICQAVGTTGFCADVEAGEDYQNASSLLACPEGNEEDGSFTCKFACSEEDYCGVSEECLECGADGTISTNILEGYEQKYVTDAKIYEIGMPAGIAGLEEKAPYKYFVSNPDNSPFIFSAVVPLSANAVFNQINEPIYGYSDLNENLVAYDKAQFPMQCKVRQGVYLLQTKTSNGVEYFGGEKDNGKYFQLSPLMISQNYPNTMGDGQDYCGNTYACNIFDPYDVETADPKMKDYFNKTKYLDRCFTWEWPIIPEPMKWPNDGTTVSIAVKPYGGVRTAFAQSVTESKSALSGPLTLVGFLAAGAVVGVIVAPAVLGVVGGTTIPAITGFTVLPISVPTMVVTVGHAYLTSMIIATAAGGVLYGMRASVNSHPKKWLYQNPDFYQFPVSQQNPANLEKAYTMGHILYWGGKSCWGCNDVEWNVASAGAPPYDITKYPHPFGKEWLSKSTSTKLDPDDVDHPGAHNFGPNGEITHTICGKDVRENQGVEAWTEQCTNEN